MAWTERRIRFVKLQILFFFPPSVQLKIRKHYNRRSSASFGFFQRASLSFFYFGICNVELYCLERLCRVTNKYAARVITFDNIPVHEAGELYINPRDAAQFINVMITQVYFRCGTSYNFEFLF